MSRNSLAIIAGLLSLTAVFWKRSKAKRALSEEHVLIVGASSGVGLELALLYARQPGVHLHLVARRSLQDVAEQCRGLGVNGIDTTQGDVTSPEAVVDLVNCVRRRWDRIDTLIICVGALTIQPVLTLTAQVTRSTPTLVESEATSESLTRLDNIAITSYKLNVLSPLMVTAACVNLLLASTSPRVAVLSSVAADVPAPTRALYGANKAAVSMLMRSLRIELDNLTSTNARGVKKAIGITIVNPASIATGLRSSALDAAVSASAHSVDRKAMSAAYVARRIIAAIQNHEDEIWLPGSYWWISKIGLLVVPAAIKKGAKRKYDYK